MKTLYIALIAVLVSFNANAGFDVAGSLNKAAAKVDATASAVEAQKAEVANTEENGTSALEAKKAEVENTIAAKKAEGEAKAAEDKAAVENVKNSVDNLKKALQ